MLAEHGFETTQYEDRLQVFMPPDEVNAIGQDYDAIITMGIPIGDDFLSRTAPRLKIIARYGSGYDEIDAELAGKYGVAVTISKEVEHTNGVAETAYAHILAMLYHIPQNYRDLVVKHSWHQEVRNTQLRGKTVGFFGFGAIAQCLAGKLQCAGVTMLATDTYPNHEAAKKAGVNFVPFDELLAKSDIISIHVPGTKENRHIFNNAVFSKMKDGAYLVNTARGILVDENALYDALAGGKLKAAAVDVFDREPACPDNPLFTLDNFTATPHIAGHTIESRKKLCISTAQAVIDCFDGKKPFLLVN
jgi:D-3-phosphoglycerate dehydrogenase